MLEHIKTVIEQNHRHVVYLIIALTLVFSMFVPAIEFRTRIEDFYPDNDATRADHTIETYFGKDPLLQYIHVTPKGDDPSLPDGSVLSLPALQEMYNITRQVRELPGVLGTISVAEYLHTFLTLNESEPSEQGSVFLRTNWSTLKDFLFDLGSANSQEQFFFLQEFLIHNDWKINPVLEKGLPPEADATLIIVEIDAHLPTEDRKELANRIRETVNTMPLTYVETEQAGADLMAYQVDEVSNRTLVLLGAGILALIVLILFLSFRRWSYVFLPLLTIIIAVIWTLGTMVLIGLEFTALHVAVLPLLIGLGIDYSIHVSRRYQEELRKCASPRISMAITMKSIGTAIFLTSLTTVIAFLSNGFSGVKPVRDFGIVCAIGIAYAFILTMTFYVAMRYWLDRKGGEQIMCTINGEGPDMDRIISRMSSTIDSQPKMVVIFVAAITLLSLYGATQVRTEFDVTEFLPEDLPSLETANSMREEFRGGSYTTAYILYQGENLATVQAMDAVDQTYENAKDDRHLVNISIYSFGIGGLRKSYQITTPLTVVGQAIDNDRTLAARYNFTRVRMQGEFRDKWLPSNTATDRDIKGILDYLYENTTETDPITGNTYGGLIRSVVHRNQWGEFNALLIRMYVRAITSGESREVYEDITGNIVGTPGARTATTGTVILIIQTIDSIQTSQIHSTVVAIILAALILCLIYRNAQLGIITIIPVGLNVTWILGFMAFVSYLHGSLEGRGLWNPIPDLSLNVLTVTVTSLAIGLGIDYAIHVVERFRESLKDGQLSVQEAIHTTLEHTGSALFISAITTVAGFGVLIFAPMPLIKMFGIITAASIVFSLLSTTILLPILLVAWARHHGHFTIPQGLRRGLRFIKQQHPRGPHI